MFLYTNLVIKLENIYKEMEFPKSHVHQSGKIKEKINWFQVQGFPGQKESRMWKYSSQYQDWPLKSKDYQKEGR